MTAGRNAQPAASPAIVPFRVEQEADFTTGFDWTDKTTPPALIVNPAADAGVVLGAAASRAARLVQSLEAWWAASSEGLEGVKLIEVVGPLWPLAQEVQLLIEAAQSLVHRAGRPS